MAKETVDWTNEEINIVSKLSVPVSIVCLNNVNLTIAGMEYEATDKYLD